jgi:hypothetical protein
MTFKQYKIRRINRQIEKLKAEMNAIDVPIYFPDGKRNGIAFKIMSLRLQLSHLEND